MGKSKRKQPSMKADTARNRVRQEIADHTKPKRDAFLLAHSEYFLPLLPETSYIDKLQRVHAMNDEDEPEYRAHEKLTKQPDMVKALMKPYQLDGLSFLVHMYHNGMSAILGDEMGLGKTLQTLALFAHLSENEPKKGENRPHLVVCPLSVLSSWINEAKRWTPDLNVLRFHGPKAERDRMKLEAQGKIDKYGNQTLKARNKNRETRTAKGSRVVDLDEPEYIDAKPIDVVVTTYETFTSEQSWFKTAFVWRYCVLDEGHKVKNEKSEISRAVQGLNAEFRLLLTGTPLQNNLKEMWALLRWLYPDVFTEKTGEKFDEAFNLTKGKVSTNFMDDARRLLELIMLRRMKNTPGVNLGLPPKEEIQLYVPLTPMQRFWYTRLLTKAGNGVLEDLFKGAKDKELVSRQQEAIENQKIDLLAKVDQQITDVKTEADDVWAESKEIMEQALQNDQADTNTSDWRKLMNLIMQLRKVCIHPYVFVGARPDPYDPGDHIRTASGKFVVLDKLIDELVIKQKKKILIFSGFTETLNLCEDMLFCLKDANTQNAPFRYQRIDGGTGRAMRNLAIRMFNQKNSDFRVMLISTRAGGLGINLASASDVVFMDEDWNPQITLQAEARAHRIGQTQKVTVYKICTQGTVEEQMMGRIRKKLYLSAKITESMRSIHADSEPSLKRKRGPSSQFLDDDAPQLGTTQLKSLIRRGAQTLSRPELDVTEMLGWSWETTLKKCKDNADDPQAADQQAEIDEEKWLNTMEKVECAVFDGKRHQREIDQAAKAEGPIARADRRVGKNTTVMIDGFAINKESLSCADWEAVPTMAGKDPRLAEVKREKKAAVNNQEQCQVCRDGGEIVCCLSCPRSYHPTCLNDEFQAKAQKSQFYCPQHQCADCEKKTGDAGGLIYRCRWCEKGYCEDCLDWETVKLVGDSLKEFEILDFVRNHQAYYIECPTCIQHWDEHPEDRKMVEREERQIDKMYKKAVAAKEAAQARAAELEALSIDTPGILTTGTTPKSVSGPATPLSDSSAPVTKKRRVNMLTPNGIIWGKT